MAEKTDNHFEAESMSQEECIINKFKQEEDALKGILEKEKMDKDWKVFENLSKDKDVQNSLNKVFNKCSNEVFAEERKQFEKVNVSETLDNILNTHPDLRFYITGTLGLPLGTTNFSSLTNEQKIKFCALCDSIKQKNFLQPKNLVDRCNSALNGAQAKINSNFKWKNISNRGMLEKTLSEDFGLTETEMKNFKEYLLLIKKHPEYIGVMRVQECGIGKFGWGMIVGAIAAILAGFGIQHIVNMGKPNPETIQTLGETVIDEPQSILKLLTQSSNFSTSGSMEKSLYTIGENDGIVAEYLKKAVNSLETKEIKMTLEGELNMVYDMDGSTLTVNHTTGEVLLRVKKPDVLVLNSKAKVIKRNGEVIEMQTFDNVELELEEQLKEKAINEAKDDPNFYEQAKIQTEQDLYQMFKELQIYGVDVKSVKVEYIDEIKTPTINFPAGK